MFKRTAFMLMLAASAVAVTAPVMAKDDKAKDSKVPTGKPSKGAAKFLTEIQTLAAAKDWAGVKAKLAEAEAVPGLNSFDTYFINQYRYNAGIELKDNAMIMAGLEVMGKSEFVAAEQKPKIYRNLLVLASQQKDNVKGKAYAEQYLQLVPDDQDVQLYLVEQMQKAKDYAGADARLLQMINSNQAAGKAVPENAYLRLAIGREQSKSAGFPDALYMLVNNYPTTRNWNFLLENFQTRTGMIGRAGIDLFRLMNATGALNNAASVVDAAQTALDAGVPGDAKIFVEKAQTAGLLTDRKAEAATILKSAQTAIATEEAPAKQEAAATNGDRLASVGQLYLSLGNYAKATDVYTRALAKGVRSKNEATLRMGIAKFMGGDAAGAKSAWTSIAGDIKLAELAKLWALYADKKQ